MTHPLATTRASADARPGRATRPRRRRAAGQALVELALVILPFVVIVVGAFDLGAGVFAYNSVTNAVREGVRVAIVNQDQASIESRALGQTAIAETLTPNVAVSFFRPGPNADPTLNARCPSPVPVGCLAVVSFQTTYRPFTPLIREILFAEGVTLTARSVLPVEFTCPTATIPASQCPKQP